MIMNWLGKMFKKKKDYPKSNNFKLCIIEDNTDILHTTLGITEERAKVLAEICRTAFTDYSRVTDSYDHIFNHCKHINEVVMCTEMFIKIRLIDAQKRSFLNLFDKDE